MYRKQSTNPIGFVKLAMLNSPRTISSMSSSLPFNNAMSTLTTCSKSFTEHLRSLSAIIYKPSLSQMTLTPMIGNPAES